MGTLTNQTIAERASYDLGVAVQDVSTADVTGEYVDMQGFGRVAAVAVTDELAADDAVSIQLVQATDSSGTDSKDLGDAVSVTGTADTAEQLFAEAHVNDLDTANDFRYVAVQISATPDGSTTINAGASMLRADGSYRP